jgi:hypothetical protein
MYISFAEVTACRALEAAHRGGAHSDSDSVDRAGHHP